MSKGFKKTITLDKSLFQVIKYQLIMHSFSKDQNFVNNELECLSYLGLYQPINFSDFCQKIVEDNLYKNTQAVRNIITKSIKLGMVVRSGTGNKMISLNSELNIITEGNILITSNIIHREK